MMAMKRELTREDILPVDVYAAERKERKKALLAIKKHRRQPVGPDCTFYFENYDTMWSQVHEMLYIERGGEDQIIDELSAYNPLIPSGDELVATVMFEIDDPVRRAAVLGVLGGIEETAFISFGGETVTGMPEADVDRTSAAGKASSVQFIHFPFTPEQIKKFRNPGVQVTLGFKHPRYGHMVMMQEEIRASLAEDFS